MCSSFSLLETAVLMLEIYELNVDLNPDKVSGEIVSLGKPNLLASLILIIDIVLSLHFG